MAFKVNFLLLFCSSFAFIVAGQETCTTAPCKALADTLQHRSMNTSVKPCDDFYEYVCGNYPKFNPINPSYEWSGSFLSRQLLVLEEINEAFKNALNSSSKAIKYVAELYSECRDTDAWERRGTAPLVQLVEATVGGWPMLGKKNATASQPKRTWQDIFVDVFSKAGLSYIFDIRDSLGILRFQAGMVVMNRDNRYQPSFISNETVIAHYRAFLLNLTAALGVTNASSGTDRAQQIEHLIHFEQNLEKIYNHPPLTDDFEGTLGQFEKGATHGKVSWSKLIQRIQANFAKQSSSLKQTPYNESSKTDARLLHYINEAVALLETTPIEVVQNFFATAIAVNYGFLTTAKVREAVFHFTGEKALLNVRASCGEIPQQWPLVMGRVYVDSHFSQAEKAAATRLVAEIRASFRENLQRRAQWLDAPTRKYAIEKLDAITAEIGYPDWILDNEKMDNFYPDLKTAYLQKEKLFEKIIKQRALFRASELEMYLPEKKNQTHITINPAAVNAFYNVLENGIMIPAGILQPPFFDHELPWSANYGAIGAIVGHELTHGFDSRGRNYDLHGKLKDWWTPSVEKQFEERAHCMAGQYNDIVEPRTREHLHGGQTLGENIADNGGIKEAFGAYQAHTKAVHDSKVLPGLKFSPDQLFFVSYANIWCQAITVKRLKYNMLIDPHAPNKYRVNVLLGNFDQFSKAFNCPAGSKMNPVNKCSIW